MELSNTFNKYLTLRHKNVGIKNFICLFLMLTAELILAQEDISLHSTVGFSCSFAGTPTIAVRKMSKLIQRGSYQKIRKLLWSKDTGEIYLAVVTCEALDKKGTIQLNADEQDHIAKLYRFHDNWVSICSGCTLFMGRPLHELLQDHKGFGNIARKWVQLEIKKTDTINNQP